MNDMNCGTQLKLSAFLTNILILFLAYNFICSDKTIKMKLLYRIGNFSFGIYFSHLAIMQVLRILPFYLQIYFPFNGLIVIIVSYIFVYLGKKVLKEYAKYFAF